MEVTLVILFSILFALGLFLDHRTKIVSIKQEESNVFENTLAEKGIAIKLMLSESYNLYTPTLWRSRNFVHKIFMDSSGKYFLYMRSGGGVPVIQVISKERALSSRTT